MVVAEAAVGWWLFASMLLVCGAGKVYLMGWWTVLWRVYGVMGAGKVDDGEGYDIKCQGFLLVAFFKSGE